MVTRENFMDKYIIKDLRKIVIRQITHYTVLATQMDKTIVLLTKLIGFRSVCLSGEMY